MEKTDVSSYMEEMVCSVVELKFQPERLDLVMEEVRVLLEAGYDVAIERVFEDEFVPPRLIYYSVNIRCNMNIVDETGRVNDKDDK